MRTAYTPLFQPEASMVKRPSSDREVSTMRPVETSLTIIVISLSTLLVKSLVTVVPSPTLTLNTLPPILLTYKGLLSNGLSPSDRLRT